MIRGTERSHFRSIYNYGFVPILIALVIVFYLGCQEGGNTGSNTSSWSYNDGLCETSKGEPCSSADCATNICRESDGICATNEDCDTLDCQAANPDRCYVPCSDGETRPCSLQEGVCSAYVQTCSEGEWQPCAYGVDYEPIEVTNKIGRAHV